MTVQENNNVKLLTKRKKNLDHSFTYTVKKSLSGNKKVLNVRIKKRTRATLLKIKNLCGRTNMVDTCTCACQSMFVEVCACETGREAG